MNYLELLLKKVSEESCTEQCESCQKYCPASEERMAKISIMIIQK